MPTATFHGQGDLAPGGKAANTGFGNPVQSAPVYSGPTPSSAFSGAAPGAPGVTLDAAGNPVQAFNPWPMGGAGAAPPPSPAGPTIPQGDYSTASAGPAEANYNEIGDRFNTPTAGELMAASMIPGIVAPGAAQDYWNTTGQNLTGNTGAGNLAAQAYQDFQANRPDIATDPGLQPYYDNAQRLALEGISRNSAAAGGYGSSTFQDVSQEAITNLRADQARNEADYNLRRIGEERGWAGMGLEGANMAAQNQLGWAGTLGDIAYGAEEANLARGIAGGNLARGLGHDAISRLTSGGGVAEGAGAERLGRIFGQFNADMGFGNAVSGALGTGLGAITEQDLALLEASGQGELAALIRQAEEADENQASNTQGTKDVLGFAQEQDII